MKPAASIACLPIVLPPDSIEEDEGHSSKFFQVLDESMCVVREDLTDWLQRYLFSTVDAPQIPPSCLLTRLQSGLWLSRLAYKLHLSVLGNEVRSNKDPACKYNFLRGAVSNLHLNKMSANSLPAFPKTLVQCAKLQLQPRDTCSFAEEDASSFVSLLQTPDLFAHLRVADRWIARDNVSCFIGWCNDLGIPQTVLFETTGLVHRTEEKNVILTLMELARIASRFGLTDLPELVRMEREIDDVEAILAEHGEAGLESISGNANIGPGGDQVGPIRGASDQLRTNYSSSSTGVVLCDASTSTNDANQDGSGDLRKSGGSQNDLFGEETSEGRGGASKSTTKQSETTPVRRNADTFVNAQTPKTALPYPRTLSDTLTPLRIFHSNRKRKSSGIDSRILSGLTSPTKVLRLDDDPLSCVSPTSVGKCETPLSTFGRLNLDEGRSVNDQIGHSVSPIFNGDFDHITQQVEEKVAQCTCCSRISLQYLNEGRYRLGNRVYYFRRFRNHVMVRIGGGWLTLDAFLNSHDPCRRGKSVESQARQVLHYSERKVHGTHTTRSSVRSAETGCTPVRDRKPSGLVNAKSVDNLLATASINKTSIQPLDHNSPTSPESIITSPQFEEQEDSDYSSLGSTVLNISNSTTPQENEMTTQARSNSALPPKASVRSANKVPLKSSHSNATIQRNKPATVPQNQKRPTTKVDQVPGKSIQNPPTGTTSRLTVPRGPKLHTATRSRTATANPTALPPAHRRPSTPTTQPSNLRRPGTPSSSLSKSLSTNSIPKLVKKTF